MIDLSQLEPVKTDDDIRDQSCVAQAQAYLNETNWHAFALLEDGTPIPEAIRSARTDARATIIRLSLPESS